MSNSFVLKTARVLAVAIVFVTIILYVRSGAGLTMYNLLTMASGIKLVAFGVICVVGGGLATYLLIIEDELLFISASVVTLFVAVMPFGSMVAYELAK